MADLRLQLEEATRQAEEDKEHDAALDDLLKQKQELIQERENQVRPLYEQYDVVYLMGLCSKP